MGLQLARRGVQEVQFGYGQFERVSPLKQDAVAPGLK
jgi:hypothetical protein